MIGYKGFNEKMQCRGKQYEVGETYTEDKADLCKCGMHFCEYPLDVFSYYSPAEGRFCKIEADEVADETESCDTKRVCKKLTVKAKLGIPGIVSAAVEYIKNQVDWEKSKESNDEDMSAATNTGDMSAATNTGDRSAATNTGHRSAATNTGDRSAATNTGDMSAATNTGHMSAATNTGDRSAATNTGDRSAAVVEGKESVACALGINGKAKGALGCWLVLAEWKEVNPFDWHRISVRIFKVDGKRIKANTFYTLVGGKAVRADEE